MTDSRRAIRFERDVAVVAGRGHVGLPLAIALAGGRLTLAVHDISQAAGDLDAATPLDAVLDGVIPWTAAGLKAGTQ